MLPARTHPFFMVISGMWVIQVMLSEECLGRNQPIVTIMSENPANQTTGWHLFCVCLYCVVYMRRRCIDYYKKLYHYDLAEAQEHCSYGQSVNQTCQ